MFAWSAVTVHLLSVRATRIYPVLLYLFMQTYEEETPFEWNMNIQYNQDIDVAAAPSEASEDSVEDSLDKLKLSSKPEGRTARISTRLA